MYETFEKLEESKKNQILQVCIEEFARNGYENTSTNTIVKRLGISKGVLFLYFKSKKNLYLYIVNHLTTSLTNEFLKHYTDEMKVESLDIFDHLGEFYNIIMQDNPHILKFMLDAFLNAPVDLRKEIEYEHNHAHEETMRIINKDKLREDVDTQMVIDMLHIISYHVGQMIFKDYGEKMEELKDNIGRYSAVYEKYINIIKYGVYK